MNFGKLILRKIIKIPATKRHISKLKCTKFVPAALTEMIILSKLV